MYNCTFSKRVPEFRCQIESGNSINLLKFSHLFVGHIFFVLSARVDALLMWVAPHKVPMATIEIWMKWIGPFISLQLPNWQWMLDILMFLKSTISSACRISSEHMSISNQIVHLLYGKMGGDSFALPPLSLSLFLGRRELELLSQFKFKTEPNFVSTISPWFCRAIISKDKIR